MYKLINPIRSYCWGSKTAFTDLYGLPNPEQKPMAEMWMGAHPLASSRLIREQGPPVTLEHYIAESPQRRLGEKVARQYHQLPFFIKITGGR